MKYPQLKLVWRFNVEDFATHSDLEGPSDMSVWKMASEVPSTTPTAIIAGWSFHCTAW